MPFPVDQVPDGSVWLAHHFVYGAWAALFVCWLVSTDDDKPWGVGGGLVVALFGWYHLWPTGKPVLGALFVLGGMAGASAALARPVWREQYDRRHRVAAGLCLLVAWDDVLNHAFALWMPLDWAWQSFLWQIAT